MKDELIEKLLKDLRGMNIFLLGLFFGFIFSLMFFLAFFEKNFII